jgi:hypothetical protein
MSRLASMISALQPARLAPETLTWFRVGQLLLLLEVASDLGVTPLKVDRLAYYDFFSANPFLVVTAGSVEATDLQLAGFSRHNLDYQSAPQRFANRRARLEHDLSLLVAFGLVDVGSTDRAVVGFSLAQAGREMAGRLTSLYAGAYRQSARMVVRRLKSLSERGLRDDASRWLRAEGLLMDLYDT